MVDFPGLFLFCTERNQNPRDENKLPPFALSKILGFAQGLNFFFFVQMQIQKSPVFFGGSEGTFQCLVSMITIKISGLNPRPNMIDLRVSKCCGSHISSGWLLAHVLLLRSPIFRHSLFFGLLVDGHTRQTLLRTRQGHPRKVAMLWVHLFS